MALASASAVAAAVASAFVAAGEFTSVLEMLSEDLSIVEVSLGVMTMAGEDEADESSRVFLVFLWFLALFLWRALFLGI